MPVAGSAPMSAVAARKARAAAAVAEAEAAAASISSTSSKQSSKSPGASVRLATPTSNAKASTSALPQPRIRKSADTNKKTQEAAKDLSDSDSPPDLESILDDVKAQDGAIRPPARKRPRSVQKGDGKILKDRQTSRPPKLPGSSRYFANGSKQEDPAQKTDMGAKSTVPMEDAESGFLAFSGMTSGKSESEESTEQSEDDGISSDEDSDREKEASSTDLPETRDSRTTSQSAASPAVLSSGRMSSPDQTITSGTVNSIGPTIPYSGFVADIDTNCLIHQMNNKQKDADAYTFGLRSGETLTFVGIGHVEVLKGKLQVGGAVLSSPDSISGVSSANIFAPTYHPLPLLKAIATWSEGSDSTQYPAHFAASTFSTIIRISPLESSIIDLLQVCAVGGTTPPFSAPSNLPLLKFPPLPTLRMLLEPDDASLTGQQQYLLANNIAISVGLSATYIPHSWQIALNKLSESVRLAADDTQEEPVTALIRGPKKVGKSTFSRMILERVLTMGQEMGGKVAFLELDLGQSDFGPPGMVSLHVLDSAATCTIGPGWCQPRIPIRAHFIGDLSPKDEPSSYMEAIVDLIAYFRANIQSAQTRNRVPLVVNTQGWVKGLGADLATRIESLICPTNVYEIVPRGSVDPVPSPVRGQAWLDAEGAILAPGAEIVTLESVNQTGFVPGVFNSKPIEYQASLSMPSVGGGDGGPVPPPYVTDFPPRLTPADLRILNIMTYLYAQDLAVGTSDVKWDFSRPLVNMRPLIVDVETGLAAGVRVLPLGSSIPDGHKLGALNASIVAIVACDNALQTTEIVNTDQMTRAKFVWQKSFRCGALNLMPNSSTRCLGLGIVRSIDVLRGEFHLLTPLSAEFLSTCGPLGLVKGVLELPIWASLDFDALKDVKDSKLDVAPLTYPTAANGAQATLAGVARNRVPYIEWPWIPPISRTLSYSQGATRPTRHATSKNAKKNARQQKSTLATLGSQKRKWQCFEAIVTASAAPTRFSATTCAIFNILLLAGTLTLVAGDGLPTTPYATRFWDCCPAAYSYPKASLYSPVEACKADGVTPFPFDNRLPNSNGCAGGSRFACNCIQPWIDSKDPKLGYGFAAYNIQSKDIEGACYLAEFAPHDANGKPIKIRKIILQNINTSGNIMQGSFDFNLAGGGVGDWPQGCVNQWGSTWGGAQYGGVRGAQECFKLPPGLRSSCLFRFEFFGENPTVAGTPRRVRCPKGIIDRSGAQRKDDQHVAPYSGVTDKTGAPAPDKYIRNRAVCNNADPLNIVQKVCALAHKHA